MASADVGNTHYYTQLDKWIDEWNNYLSDVLGLNRRSIAYGHPSVPRPFHLVTMHFDKINMLYEDEDWRTMFEQIARVSKIAAKVANEDPFKSIVERIIGHVPRTIRNNPNIPFFGAPAQLYLNLHAVDEAFNWGSKVWSNKVIDEAATKCGVSAASIRMTIRRVVRQVLIQALGRVDPVALKTYLTSLAQFEIEEISKHKGTRVEYDASVGDEANRLFCEWMDSPSVSKPSLLDVKTEAENYRIQMRKLSVDEWVSLYNACKQFEKLETVLRLFGELVKRADLDSFGAEIPPHLATASPMATPYQRDDSRSKPIRISHSRNGSANVTDYFSSRPVAPARSDMEPIPFPMRSDLLERMPVFWDKLERKTTASIFDGGSLRAPPETGTDLLWRILFEIPGRIPMSRPT